MTQINTTETETDDHYDAKYHNSVIADKAAENKATRTKLQLRLIVAAARAITVIAIGTMIATHKNDMALLLIVAYIAEYLNHAVKKMG